MAYNEKLAARIAAILASHDGLTERKMFGGLTFMLNGHMCCGVTTSDLMIRVGPDAYEDSLAQPHARPMDFTGRPMKGMVYVGAAGYEDDDSLRAWVGRGVAFATSLPPK
ncbi:MAG: TfoX/Sxy family protein [Chloroflexi bacterium]|nr:TfoX/Sxy family protein [Chloroflexota bacterium]